MDCWANHSPVVLMIFTKQASKAEHTISENIILKQGFQLKFQKFPNRENFHNFRRSLHSEKQQLLLWATWLFWLFVVNTVTKM